MNEYESYGDPLQNEMAPRSSFKRNISILRRHIWVVIAVFAIFATLGLIRAYKASPIYQATAKLLVERQGPHVTQFQGVMNSAPAWGGEFYKTQEGLIRSRAVLELALQDESIRELFEQVEAVNTKPSLMARLRNTVPAILGVPPTTPREPWERLKGYIYPDHVRDTSFIHVSVTTSNPERAAKLANAVAKAYVKYNVVRRMEISNDVFVYLEQQKSEEEAALKDSHKRLQEFREQTQISSLESSEEHPVMKRLAMLNDQLTQTQMERIGAEAQFRVAKKAIRGEGSEMIANDEDVFSLAQLVEDGTLTGIRSSLIEAEQELATISGIYGPKHPRLQTVENKIEHLEHKLRDALKDIVSTLSAQLEMLAQEEGELQRQYDDQNMAALQLAKQSLTFQSLQMEAERHQRILDVLIQRMSEVELTADYSRTNVELIETAALPKSAIGPNKRKMAGMGMLFGLIAGVGLAFFLEKIDDTIRTPEDLEEGLGVPVLGFVPEIGPARGEEKNAAYQGLVAALETESSAIEAYRNIRTSLFFSAPAEETKVLLVTSAGPGDGKTTTASNLALVIAQSGKRVLLIDADFRRPRVHKIFGLSNEVGFSSVLVGEASLEDAVQKTVHDIENIDRLDILAAGPKSPNPAELFETHSAKRLFRQLREKYDRIIVDTPPTLFVSDTSILTTISDGVILVARSGKNTGAAVGRAKRQLEGIKARIVGGILNDVKVSRFSHYYSDHYYHGYARYYRDYYSSYYSTKDARKGHEASSKRPNA